MRRRPTPATDVLHAAVRHAPASAEEAVRDGEESGADDFDRHAASLSRISSDIADPTSAAVNAKKKYCRPMTLWSWLKTYLPMNV